MQFLIPGYPIIKEWAYAGLVFDLIGATYSSIAVGAPVSGWAFMIFTPFFSGLILYFYHKKLKVKSSNETLEGSLALNRL